MSLLTNFQDLANTVKLALDRKADKSSLTGKEDTANKVTSLSSSSTDTEYPSAKAVYDVVGNVESALSSINTALAVLIGGNS